MIYDSVGMAFPSVPLSSPDRTVTHGHDTPVGSTVSFMAETLRGTPGSLLAKDAAVDDLKTTTPSGAMATRRLTLICCQASPRLLGPRALPRHFTLAALVTSSRWSGL